MVKEFGMCYIQISVLMRFVIEGLRPSLRKILFADSE